jgi:hypothetical protein
MSLLMYGLRQVCLERHFLRQAQDERGNRDQDERGLKGL